MTRCAVWVALLISLSASGARGDGGEPPNVVLIIGDDQAWTDYRFMGHPQGCTPNLDRLSREGLTYTRGYVTSSLCSPSLASILTGLYPHQHGITGNDPPQAVDRSKLIKRFESLPSLPRLLANRGYLSMQTGKWWGGSYQSGGFTHGMSHGDPSRGGRHGDEGLKIGRSAMQPAYDFLDRAQSAHKPFFLWYAPMLPHSPHDPAESLLAKYRMVAPSEAVAAYWANIERFDETIGQLLQALDSRGLTESTLIVFLSDNGWIQDPDQLNRFAPRSKQSPYDGGLRTPIILKWPGHIKPDKCDTPVSSIDLAPTILNVAGAAATKDLPGVDLLNGAAVSARLAIFGATFKHDIPDLARPTNGLRARWIVSEGWKLIVPFEKNEPMARIELFDIARDPHEERDLSNAEPGRVAKLVAQLDAWWPGEPR
jgi:arylsulfatase A-like enzyme